MPESYHFDNNRWLNFLLRKLYFYVIGVSSFIIIALTCFSGFLINKIYVLSKKDDIYIINDEGAYIGKRRGSYNLDRDKHDIIIFTKFLFNTIYNNSEYSLDDNIEKILFFFDNESRRKIFKEFDKDIRALYFMHNGISQINIKNIEIDKNKIPTKVMIDYDIGFIFAKKDSKLENTSFSTQACFTLYPVKRCKKNPYGFQAKNLVFGSKN